MRLQLIAGGLLLGYLGACATTREPPKPVEALAFSLPDLAGRQRALAEQRGQVVLVDLWATWCKPCASSFPFYAELYRRHQGEGFELWAVSVDLHDQEVAAFLQEHPVPFTVLRDPEGGLAERLDLRTMPTAFLVGRDGHVRWIHAGFLDQDQAEIEAQVERALAESAVRSSTVSAAP